VIEDYWGPVSMLPPSAPTNAQIASVTGTKQELVTAFQAHRTIWPLALSTLGAACGGIAFGVLFYSSIFPVTNEDPRQFYMMINLGLRNILYNQLAAALVGLAIILGFTLCILSLLRSRFTPNPRFVLRISWIGIVLSSLALLMIILGYLSSPPPLPPGFLP
jgi:hypothetical protein